MAKLTVEPTLGKENPISKARGAISDLFLDTELQDYGYESIARQLRETGLPLDELDRIYSEEVAPAVYMNLRVLPGGVWGGFNINDLESRIDENEERIRNRKNHPLFWKVYQWWITRETKDDWYRVRDLFLKQPAGNPDA
jgi:hypothetical protein